MLTSCVRSLVLQLSGNLIQQDGALKIAQELPDVERLNEAQTLGPAELARRRGSQLTGLSAPVRDSSKNMSKALRDDFRREGQKVLRELFPLSEVNLAENPFVVRLAIQACHAAACQPAPLLCLRRLLSCSRSHLWQRDIVVLREVEDLTSVKGWNAVLMDLRVRQWRPHSELPLPVPYQSLSNILQEQLAILKPIRFPIDFLKGFFTPKVCMSLAE